MMASLLFCSLCVTRCGVGVRSLRVVIMIRRWSEGSVCTVCHVVFVLVLENRRLCLGGMCGNVPGVGCECTVLYCLAWTYC